MVRDESAGTGSRRSSTRSANTQRVVDCLRSDGPSSQAAIARRTGLSPATVNSIVGAMRQDGSAEVRPVNGREMLVSLVSKQGTVLAIEVGHDAVWGSAFVFRDEVRLPSRLIRRSEPRAVLAVVKDLARQCGLAPSELAGVAISIQAPIDRSRDAVAAWVTNRLPSWRDVPLTKTFGRAIGAPVVIDNDANFAALAEWAWGVGRGVDDFLYVKAAAGVGGGLVINGSIYHGGSGMAGVLGHLVVEPSGEVCYCGSRGCLTTLISQRAILLAVRASQANSDSLAAVIDSAREGDPACRRVLADAGRYLGRGIANATKVMAPSVVAIGGTLGAAGPLVLEGVRSALEVRNLRSLAPATRIEAATLTNDDVSLLGGVCAVLATLDQGLSDLPAWMTTHSADQPPVEIPAP